RMLVLRDRDDEGCFILFSDVRSEKIATLQANPQAHLMFWHPRKQVQIGVHAMVQVHREDELSHSCMKQVSQHGRQQYTSIRPPSAAIDVPESGQECDDALFETNFCVLRARPWRITALQLRREGHLRLRFEKAGNTWEGGWITP
ncbi:MAG: pyridoxamine 5'-phosphate oxidase family protein, partial [Cyclonatronaceae bacterium]